MTYQSKWDAVAGEIEERKILEIEKYGLVMTTHRLFFEKGTFGSFNKKADDLFGHPAELVAFVGKAGSGYEKFIERLGLIGQCRVNLIYVRDEFLMYDLPDKIRRLIDTKGVPLWENAYDDAGKYIGTGVEAYYFSDNMPKSEGYELAQLLNGGFEKARNLFSERINAKAKARREFKERYEKERINSFKNMKEL